MLICKCHIWPKIGQVCLKFLIKVRPKTGQIFKSDQNGPKVEILIRDRPTWANTRSAKQAFN